MESVVHVFEHGDLVAGHPALDLVNTATAWDQPVPVDWLGNYDSLIDWAALAGVVEVEEAAVLRRSARAHPDLATVALADARGLRDALREVATDLITMRSPAAGSLLKLETRWKAAVGRSCLAAAKVPGLLVLKNAPSHLEVIGDRTALRAVDLFHAFPAHRARICRGTYCGWLFIDTSKGGRRVWCDMATCGNAAKSRRHRHRHEGASARV